MWVESECLSSLLSSSLFFPRHSDAVPSALCLHFPAGSSYVSSRFFALASLTEALYTSLVPSSYIRICPPFSRDSSLSFARAIFRSENYTECALIVRNRRRASRRTERDGKRAWTTGDSIVTSAINGNLNDTSRQNDSSAFNPPSWRTLCFVSIESEKPFVSLFLSLPSFHFNVLDSRHLSSKRAKDGK